MSIVSFSYLLFVAALLVVYYIVPKRYQYIVLLIGSISFYSFSGIKYIACLLFTTLTTYYGGKYIHKVSYSKWLVGTIITSNLMILGVFKYYHMLVVILKSIFEMNSFTFVEYLILPLGISFYMFQSIAYLMDVYFKRINPENNLLKYTLFISYFPQIIQGPISRYQDLGNQLTVPRNFNFDSVRDGIYAIIIGLMKKMVIANRLDIMVRAVMDNHLEYSGSVIFFIIFVYGIQIYCDFSGGISIIRGVSLLFDIRLTENFRRPILATSVADFWRRWHITLGTFMRDYVFYPLTMSKWFASLNKKSRKKFGPFVGKIIIVSLSTLIVYLLVGIWHGSSFKFIAFGLWHGLIISLSLATQQKRAMWKTRFKVDDNSLLLRIYQIFLTTVLVTIGRYFSRASSFIVALSMFKRTLLDFNIGQLFDGTILALGLSGENLIIVFLGIIIIYIYELIEERGYTIRGFYEKQPTIVAIFLMVLVLGSLTYFGIYAENIVPTEFIYMQF